MFYVNVVICWICVCGKLWVGIIVDLEFICLGVLFGVLCVVYFDIEIEFFYGVSGEILFRLNCN